MGRRCGLARFLDERRRGRGGAEEVLDIFDLIVDLDAGVSVPAVLRVLARRGYDGGLSTINTHRQRLCRACVDLKTQLDKKGKP